MKTAKTNPAALVLIKKMNELEGNDFDGWLYSLKEIKEHRLLLEECVTETFFRRCKLPELCKDLAKNCKNVMLAILRKFTYAGSEAKALSEKVFGIVSWYIPEEAEGVGTFIEDFWKRNNREVPESITNAIKQFREKEVIRIAKKVEVWDKKLHPRNVVPPSKVPGISDTGNGKKRKKKSPGKKHLTPEQVAERKERQKAAHQTALAEKERGRSNKQRILPERPSSVTLH